jgi:uncharacterized membrane protein
MLNREALCGAEELLLQPDSTLRSYDQSKWPQQTRRTFLQAPRHSHSIKTSLHKPFPLQNADVGDADAPIFAPARDSSGLPPTASQCPGIEEPHRRSLAKAISWRSAASIDTFVLSFLITGSIKMAGSISAVEIGTKILLFYLHERIWTLVPWGRR